MSNLKERIDLVMQNLPISMEELNSKYVSKNEVPYIQHTPDSVEKTQADFLKICDEVLKSDYYTTGKIHRQGIIGRYLDDCGVSELYSTWTRFMCIDEQYREWSQPYYAHPDKVKESDMLCINTLEPELISYFRDKKLEQILIESELQKSVRNLLKIKEDQKRLGGTTRRAVRAPPPAARRGRRRAAGSACAGPAGRGAGVRTPPGRRRRPRRCGGTAGGATRPVRRTRGSGWRCPPRRRRPRSGPGRSGRRPRRRAGCGAGRGRGWSHLQPSSHRARARGLSRPRTPGWGRGPRRGAS